LDEALFLAKLYKNKNISSLEKENIIKNVNKILNEVLSEKLVYNPK
jgi:hypothetical protein